MGGSGLRLNDDRDLNIFSVGMYLMLVFGRACRGSNRWCSLALTVCELLLSYQNNKKREKLIILFSCLHFSKHQPQICI